MKNLKNKRGGKRKGSGRKPKPYKTQTVSFRVRVDWIGQIKDVVKKEVEHLTAKCRADGRHG